MAVSLFPWNPPSKIFNLLGTFSLAQACHLFLCKTIQILGYVSLWFKSTFIANHISGNLLRAHLDCDSKITIGWQQDTLVSYSCNDSLGGSQATKAKLNCSSAICFLCANIATNDSLPKTVWTRGFSLNKFNTKKKSWNQLILLLRPSDEPECYRHFNFIATQSLWTTSFSF